MIALIFGVNGQDGHYLSCLLRQNNIRVIGISRNAGDVRGDISDAEFVKSLFLKYQPQYIFHFAANSTTSHSGLYDNQRAIVQGTINLLDNARLYSPLAKIFLSGSALQFENKGLPIDELTPFSGSSPYAIDRIHSTYMGRYYRETFGIQVYIGYFFHHDSPLRSEKHVNKKIAAAAQRIAKGSTEKLPLGNIEVKKEFNFAADLVEALWILINQDQVFEVVLGSGQVYSIKDWLHACFSRVGKCWEDYVVVDKEFLADYKILVSNPALIKSLHWSPKVHFELLADLMMLPDSLSL